MFADACSKAAEFCRPLIVSTRTQDGQVTTEYGSFIVVNRDGWFITAAHLFNSFEKYQIDRKKVQEINELNETREEHEGTPSKAIKLDPKFIINHSFWWGWDRVGLKDVYVDRQLDIAVGRLTPFNPSTVSAYPVLRDPSTIRPGTSICRSGYAMLNIHSEWDDQRKAFKIPAVNYKEVILPLEGMHTRTINTGKTKNGKYDRILFETSSPGLKGQSGGPIFDVEGRVCAMQTSTVSAPLGITPTVETGGQTVVENLFINFGMGLHVRSIRQVLDDRGVRYDSEDSDQEFRIIG